MKKKVKKINKKIVIIMVSIVIIELAVLYILDYGAEKKELLPSPLACDYDWTCDYADGETSDNCLPDCYSILCINDNECPNPNRQDCIYYGGDLRCLEKCQNGDHYGVYCNPGEVCFNGECELPCYEMIDGGYNPEVPGILTWRFNNELDFFEDKCIAETNNLIENYCGPFPGYHLFDYYRSEEIVNCEELGKYCKTKDYNPGTGANQVEVGYCADKPRVERVFLSLDYKRGAQGQADYLDYSYYKHLENIKVDTYRYSKAVTIEDKGGDETSDCTKQCTDTDGGKKYQVFGATTGHFRNQGNLVHTYQDVCSESNNIYLNEYYCRDDNLVDYEYIKCPNGCVTTQVGNNKFGRCKITDYTVITEEAGFSGNDNRGIVCEAKVIAEEKEDIDLQFTIFARDSESKNFEKISSESDYKCYKDDENKFTCVHKIPESLLKRGTQIVCVADFNEPFSQIDINNLQSFTNEERKDTNKYFNYSSQEEIIVAAYKYPVVKAIDNANFDGIRFSFDDFYLKSTVNNDIKYAAKEIYFSEGVLDYGGKKFRIQTASNLISKVHDFVGKRGKSDNGNEFKIDNSKKDIILLVVDQNIIENLFKHKNAQGLVSTNIFGSLIFETIFLRDNFIGYTIAHELGGHIYSGMCDEYNLYIYRNQKKSWGSCSNALGEDGGIHEPACCYPEYKCVLINNKDPMYLTATDCMNYKAKYGKTCTLQTNSQPCASIPPPPQRPPREEWCGDWESCGMPYNDFFGSCPIDITYHNTDNNAKSTSIMGRDLPETSIKVFPQIKSCPTGNC